MSQLTTSQVTADRFSSIYHYSNISSCNILCECIQTALLQVSGSPSKLDILYYSSTITTTAAAANRFITERY